MDLTSTHEDYLEIIFRLNEKGSYSVTVSDLAKALGCRLPTVTRTVKLLTEGHYLLHEHRGDIALSEKGRTIAEQIVHRHDDIEAFLHTVLGLSTEQAQTDACKIEHGFSAQASQRLHAFMEYFQNLHPEIKKNMYQAVIQIDKDANLFDSIQKSNPIGWRH